MWEMSIDFTIENKDYILHYKIKYSKGSSVA